MLNNTRTSIVVAICLAAFIGGCGEDEPTQSKYDATKLVANLVDAHIRPNVIAFDDDAKALYKATKAWCDAVGGAEEAAKLKGARDAFKAAMLTFQRTELMKVGPLADNGGALRDDIYSWPTVSPCAVDQGVVNLREEPDFPVGKGLVNARGLDALEYLLWAPDMDTQCAEQAEPPQWAKLSDADKLKARCNYAVMVAIDLGQRSADWKYGWQPAPGGDFGGELKGAGKGSKTFSSAVQAEQALSDALFYIDSRTKDRKLGAPAGAFDNSCGAKDKACAKDLESRWAHMGKELVLANLEAFGTLFIGGDGEGFDDHLVAVGHGKLATAIVNDTKAAMDAVQAIPGTLAEAIEKDRAKVVAARDAVKKITDILKSEFVLAVSLDLPKEAAGDAD